MDPSLRRHIRNLGIAFTAAFLFLALALAYWQIYQSSWLLRQPYNRHWSLLERQIQRGAIYDANGTALATSTGGGPGRRSYPTGSLCAHVIGYLSEKYGRTGIEGAMDAALSGMGPSPDPLQLNPLLSGLRKEGDSVVLTLDLPTQRAASAALGDRRGAVVALDPSTGRILALVSHPSYDPSTVDEDWDRLIADKASPLLDRALQGRFQPGSTFKVLTASAALDTGVDTPEDRFFCPGYININGYTIHEMDGEVHGHLTLAQALAQSCNITFAQVGLKVGAAQMLDYAHRFWVDRPLDFVLPSTVGQIVSPRKTRSDRPVEPHSDTADLGLLRVKTILAQTAFGQGQVAISPMEDAMISAAVANGGKLMKPYLVDRIVDPSGHTVKKTEPELLSTPIKPETAAAVTEMMKLTLTEGTARHLQVPGLIMAGKTGTAQNPGHKTHAWYVGFAPADHPKVLACCIVEHGGVGGVEAGPVVRSTILAALRRK